MNNLKHWGCNEVMEWICEECDKCNRCYEKIPLKNFRRVKDFLSMSREDFIYLAESKEDGEFLFDRKQLLVNAWYFEEGHYRTKKIMDWNSKDIMFWMVDQYAGNNMDYEAIPLRRFVNFTINDLRKCTKNEMIDLLGNQVDGEFLYKCKEELFFEIDRCFTVLDDTSESRVSVCSKKPGRPKTKTKTEYDKTKKCGKLWEFLRNLLMDSDTCPSLIKWDNYNEGTFKFVQSEKVAKLWGDRKNNENMNYEKFSRAMRYYYRSQVLLPVSGKRLVYKFGPNATGWKNIKPIM